MTDRLDETIFGGSAQTERSAPTGGDDEPLSRRQRRGGGRRPERRRRGLRRAGVLLVTLTLLAVGALVAVTVIRPIVEQIRAPKDYPGPGTGAVAFVVQPGDTGRAIGARLQSEGIVLTSGAFVDAFAADPKASSIQPGTYQMKKQMSAAGALAALMDPKNRTVPTVTIREGLWASEIFALLSKQTGVPLADYQAAVKEPDLIGLPASANGNVEGFLFPATYQFAPKATAVEQLKQMVATALTKLKAAGVQPADYEHVLTVASILEGEAKTTADREKVARVLLNRLNDGMKLQLDSTVSYAAQRRAVTTTDAERASKSPYNTYAHTGLPPGPIDNPGVSSITAALHPASGPWLYFVTVNPATGETLFATTAAQHQANVAKFQAWCSANPGKC